MVAALTVGSSVSGAVVKDCWAGRPALRPGVWRRGLHSCFERGADLGLGAVGPLFRQTQLDQRLDSCLLRAVGHALRLKRQRGERNHGDDQGDNPRAQPDKSPPLVDRRRDFDDHFRLHRRQMPAMGRERVELPGAEAFSSAGVAPWAVPSSELESCGLPP